MIPACGLIERALAEFDLDASVVLAGVVPERVSVRVVGLFAR